MGLDISVHVDTQLLPEHPHTDACYDEHLFVFALAGFDITYEGLAVPAEPFHWPHNPDGPAVVGGRCYTRGREVEDRSWSYGGYSALRERLSLAVLDCRPDVVWDDPDAYRDRPFYELIEFADNEGCIGPVAGAALAADFADPAHRAAFVDKPTLPEPAWRQVDDYDWLTTAFSYAGEPGFLIRFH